MAELKKELNLFQGVGLLSTSLLGSGVFAVPAIVAFTAGDDGLWAWPLLLILVLPVALIFAELGKRYPSAGGVAYFIAQAYTTTLGRATGWTFLSSMIFGLPAALYITSSFLQYLFNLTPTTELFIQIMTLLIIWFLGLFGAGASGWLQSVIAILIIVLILVIGFAPSPSVFTLAWPALSQLNFSALASSLSVMFWCFVGLEAFVHLTTEFKQPERDFPRALILGLLVAGVVYWATTAAVIYFAPQGVTETTALAKIVALLFGQQALWVFCLIGYLSCFAAINIYSQSFSRLIWSQACVDFPQSRLAKLSARQAPVNALSTVIIISLISLLVIHFLAIPLGRLLAIANGVFVLIYWLAMAAAVKLLRGRYRLLALISAAICFALLLIIGFNSLYAVMIFLLLVYLAKKVDKRTGLSEPPVR